LTAFSGLAGSAFTSTAYCIALLMTMRLRLAVFAVRPTTHAELRASRLRPEFAAA
jgi:hypothetical protein